MGKIQRCKRCKICGSWENAKDTIIWQTKNTINKYAVTRKGWALVDDDAAEEEEKKKKEEEDEDKEEKEEEKEERAEGEEEQGGGKRGGDHAAGIDEWD